MSRPRLPFLLLLLGVATSCNSGNAPRQQPSSIMPLAIGNRWIGQIVSFDAKGNTISSQPDTCYVSGTRPLNGELWYVVKGYPPAISDHAFVDTNAYLFVNRKDGLYRCINGDVAKAERWAAYPAKPRDFVYSVADSGGSYDKFVDTTNQRINAPAGAFDCYAYHMESSWSNGSDLILTGIGPEEYFAPDTGPVQYGYCDATGKSLSPGSPYEIWQLVRADLR